MFWTPGHLQFFLYRHPTDMRKSFDGLSGLVANYLRQDPLSGDVYVFLNRRKNRICCCGMATVFGFFISAWKRAPFKYRKTVRPRPLLNSPMTNYS